MFSNNTATTMAFLTLVLLEMIYAFSCRNLKERVFNKYLFGNSHLNKSMIILAIIQLLVFTTPIKKIFSIVSLNFYQVIFCILVVIIMFIIDELLKEVISNRFSDE